MANPGFAWPRRRGRRGAMRHLVWLLAAAWLIVGLLAAGRYLDAYYQHRGFAQLKRPHGVPPGRLASVNFYSPALGRQADYLVYLPTRYDPRRRYPVYYLLHGAPGRPQNFVKIAGVDVALDTLISQRRVPPMIIVMPDGRINGSMFSDSEWANAGKGNFESYVLDVVRDVDSRFPTHAVRTSRVIAGYSEGGYGAANIALHNLAVFGGTQAWSGYFVENRYAAFAHTSQAMIEANSPLRYVTGLAPQMRRYPLRAFFYAGLQDPEGSQLGPLVNELRAAGAQATYARYPGSHDWALWHAHVNAMLIGAGHDFAGVPLRRIILSPGQARAAAAEGRRAARQALALQRRHATEHAVLLKGCRADAAVAVSAGVPYEAGLDARQLRIINHQLVRNCELAVLVRHVPPAGVPAALCEKLGGDIGLVRHSARRQIPEITARCLGKPPRAARRHGA